MAKITDPSLLSKLETSQLNINGGQGKSGMSGQENMELKRARENNEGGRNIFPALANMYRVAKRYPGGIPQATYDKARLAVGSEAEAAQDSDLFSAYANKSALSKARLLAPVSNTDIEFLKSTQANPKFRFENNKALIGEEFSDASRAYFTNAFKQRWAARNGGLNGQDKQGRSYAAALADALRKPGIQQLMQPPWKRAGAKPAGGGQAVIDFNDLDD
ncbi:MAG: hypothetical protein V4618_13510 [Pseudomonadota bacterium]